jgi:hypothetical protein
MFLIWHPINLATRWVTVLETAIAVAIKVGTDVKALATT